MLNQIVQAALKVPLPSCQVLRSPSTIMLFSRVLCGFYLQIHIKCSADSAVYQLPEKYSGVLDVYET